MPQSASPASTEPRVMACLDRIFQAEMSGIHRYLQFSFMIMGHSRIPIQKWFRAQAAESMDHAVEIGEKITALGGQPKLEPATVDEPGQHSLDDILEKSLGAEVAALELYKELVRLAGDDIALEEMARGFVRTETQHIEQIRKMLRAPSC
jgi:bacterioferritin